MIPMDYFQNKSALSAELFMKHKNMNGQKEHNGDRKRPMYGQNNGDFIPDHSKQSRHKRKQDHPQKQPAPGVQLSAVHNGVDDAYNDYNGD